MRHKQKRPHIPLKQFMRRRLKEPEKLISIEEGVAFLRARPSLEKGEYRGEDPTPAGAPPTRGKETFF